MSDYDCLKIALQTKLSTDSQPFKPNFKKSTLFELYMNGPSNQILKNRLLLELSTNESSAKTVKKKKNGLKGHS